MHTVIVYVIMPNDGYEARQKSGVFAGDIWRLANNKSVIKLGDYVWQINFQESPGALAQLIVACEQHALPYRILQLDDAPQWILGDPKAK